MSRLIPLTKGYSATVDDADYEFLSQWKWHAFLGGAGHVYAARNSAFDAEGKRTHIFMHRVLCETPDGFDTDHENGNSLDNRRSNLRAATRAQNMHNRSPNRKGSSKYKGVYWHKQHRKWVASIQVHKRRYHIGLFTSEASAAEAYSVRAAAEFRDFNREQAI